MFFFSSSRVGTARQVDCAFIGEMVRDFLETEDASVLDGRVGLEQETMENHHWETMVQTPSGKLKSCFFNAV